MTPQGKPVAIVTKRKQEYLPDLITALVKCLGSAAGFSFPSLPLPPATNFFVTSVPSPCATPTCLKGNGKDCYAGYAVNKDHKLHHSNSGREKFCSANRRWQKKKQEYLSDLITALVKLNLFFSTTFPMQFTFQKQSYHDHKILKENTCISDLALLKGHVEVRLLLMINKSTIFIRL